jgi:enterochelin esterase-like enzyme
MNFKIDFISAKGHLFSHHLKREVRFRLVAPASYTKAEHKFPVLLMNDGQDYTNMHLEKVLTTVFLDQQLVPFIYVGIETNENRIQEYGASSSADFKERGSRAGNYTNFIIEEFIPFLQNEYKTSKNGIDWVYCGMSLGGLSAMDIVLNHPEKFGKVGVFSGSFWWRNKAYVKKDLADRSRIILEVIKNTKPANHLKFWFQCGTEDETADRNGNGIIDAIDDTQDVIKELKLKGYKKPEAIRYVQVAGGKHDLHTWSETFPKFIAWAFGKK